MSSGGAKILQNEVQSGAKILENEVRSGVKALPKAGARIESEAEIGAAAVNSDRRLIVCHPALPSLLPRTHRRG